ncbi:MAG: lasso RiPP family leader peptide-containing protein [Candidatus Rokubacteria bacterium]|nr:lasso RiPP family leader peptide-containing protein [Candidatus Rokubacteria bacterium]
MKPTKTSRPKKPYRTPRVTVYGDLRRLTLAKPGSKNDGAGRPRTKA